MAAYCAVVDLKNYIPEVYLKQMTDDNDVDDIDVEKAEYSIRLASDYIDSYIRGRYALPLESVPEHIVDLCAKLATYFLFKRALMQIVPESITEDYKDCTRVLMDIQKGKFSPFEVATNPVWYGSNKNKNLDIGAVSRVTNNWNSYLI